MQRPTLVQTTLRVPPAVLSDADKIAAEKGHALDRSDVLREALVEGMKVIKGRKS